MGPTPHTSGALHAPLALFCLLWGPSVVRLYHRNVLRTTHTKTDATIPRTTSLKLNNEKRLHERDRNRMLAISVSHPQTIAPTPLFTVVRTHYVPAAPPATSTSRRRPWRPATPYTLPHDIPVSCIREKLPSTRFGR
jgi:hypothetical protein